MPETLLDGALEEPANAREFVQIINSEAIRLTSLINDLLDLSKIESGALSVQLKPTRLRPLLERVINRLSRQAGRKILR